MATKHNRFAMPSDAELRANKDAHLHLFEEAERLLDQLRRIETESEQQSVGLELSPFDSPMLPHLQSLGARQQQPLFRAMQG